MKNLREFDRLTQDTRRYEFADGLVDITYGVLFLSLGLLNWFIFSPSGLRFYITALVRNREITILMVVLVFSLYILLVFGSQRLIQRIRQARFWEKSGFVKPLRMQVKWPIQFIATAVFIIALLTAYVLNLKGHLGQEAILQSLVLAVGLATSITFLGLGIDLKINRYLLVGACGIGISIVILVLQRSFSISWLLWGISWMVLLAFSGIWGLRQYQAATRSAIDE